MNAMLHLTRMFADYRFGFGLHEPSWVGQVKLSQLRLWSELDGALYSFFTVSLRMHFY